MTTAERNKQFVRTFIDEVWNRRNLDAIPRFIAADHVNHDPACPALGQGPAAYRDVVNLWAIAPDIRFSVEDVIAEGECVAARWSVTSAYNITVTGTTMLTIAGGKIVESWSNWDAAGLMHAMAARQRSTRENVM